MATLASVLTDYETNADYDEDGSSVKAKAFIVACRKLLTKMAREQQMGGAAGERIAFNVQLIKDAMDEAESWLGANVASVRYFDVSRFLD